MNPLFLVTKGIKAKKKRLAGGGGGSSLIGTKLLACNTKSAPTLPQNLATVVLTIEENNTGIYYTDPITGRQMRRTNVDDFVAKSQGTSFFNNLTNGTVALVANSSNGYVVLIEGVVHTNMGLTSNETLQLSVVQNTTGGTVTLFQATDTIAFVSGRYRAGIVMAAFGTNCGAGDIILKASVVGGGTDTDSNVIAGTAQISDAYYVKFVFS